MDSNQFRRIGIEKGAAWVNAYWCHEILQRIYFASLTGYMRMHRWMQGISQGIEMNNYLIFSASARGFLEAATDYYDAMENIPLFIAENFKIMKVSLEGKVNYIVYGFDELEERLLHFQEANKEAGKSALLLKPKTAKAYMESNNLIHLDLYRCYSELCEITHPAKSSLDLFIDDTDYIYSFNMQKDEIMINDFLTKYSAKFAELFERTENLCIITLQIVNKFRVDELTLEYINGIDTSMIRIWEKINKLMG